MGGFWDSARGLAENLATAGYLPVPFFFGFVTNAMIAALIFGPLLGILGAMVVMKRMAFFSQAVGNGALTGVSIGVLLGESYTSPYISTLTFCICFALALKFTQMRSRLSSDVVIGVFLSISLALGASLLLFVSAKLNTHVLQAIMFGSVLTVSDVDLNILLVVAIATILILVPCYNGMLGLTFSPVLAEVRGVRVKLLEYVFVLIITFVTVACLKIVGAVLVEALLLVPAAAARNISRSQPQFVIWSIIFATVSALIGILVPMLFDLAVPPGGAIVLVSAVIFLVSFLIGNISFKRRAFS